MNGHVSNNEEIVSDSVAEEIVPNSISFADLVGQTISGRNMVTPEFGSEQPAGVAWSLPTNSISNGVIPSLDEVACSLPQNVQQDMRIISKLGGRKQMMIWKKVFLNLILKIKISLLCCRSHRRRS